MKQWLVVLMSALMVLPVAVQAKPHMQMERIIEREITVSGAGQAKPKYERVKSAKAGDVLVLKYRYHNVGDETVARAQAQQAIPRNMQYLSLLPLAKGDKALVSMNGGKHFMALEQFSAKQLPPSQLTHIQWQVGAIKAGEIKELAYRVKLLGP